MRIGLDLFRNDDGAVAPTVAITLFALVAVGGVAFDYARIAGLDTELQNAADQAALAAATQLDQEAGTIARGTAAANALIDNLTFFGNDGAAAGTGVELSEVRFYASEADATADHPTDSTLCPTVGEVTDDASARFVCARTVARTANFALTPVVGASSGTASAKAVAGLGSSVCKVPPLMFCNPTETASDKTFDAGAFRGVGLRAVTQGSPGGWAPGNYGYLNTDIPNGAPGLRQALGWENPPGRCSPQTGVDTKPGVTTTVTGALNTRFDIYDSSTDCPAGGSCGASINSVKDVRRAANATGGNACRLHNNGWKLPTAANIYRPLTTAPMTGNYQMGHPRDICHYIPSGTAGSCWADPFGKGKWDRDAYFRSNYVRTVATANGGVGTRWTSGTGDGSWQKNTGLAENATRYEVYDWEINKRDTMVDGVMVMASSPAGASGATLVDHDKPVCSAAQGYSPGIIPAGSVGAPPDSTVRDRRLLSVAVINCLEHNVSGAEVDLPVIEWVDVFLVEPSLNRFDASNNKYTDQGDLYVEIIGATELAGGGTVGQVVRRDVPYLIE
ncbi:pilus assembly protein TadG-related protein [Sphingomicrobium lutaoense]|uniref:Flp pilus assembly protein TadG n=1 Tax=Sphingomicrobium lutaoense TaxID=515949 RepID=A0A839Z504_9SPHN|nr:pilus assembly protein TadG-related protein [Sphingomicrobium lutaoense]MBB3764692.1 Flp pilus assembly protein TadG [Sphingomicrobium lutaoense]